jgi:DNA (cytosine-5)-methyltransferase 1
LSRNLYIPVIDLFAGPGGLGEGFSVYRDPDGYRPFNIQLSIEKDHYASMTLKLRSFLRQFRQPPPDYYELLSDTSRPLNIRLKTLFDRYPAEAECAVSEAWEVELGKEEMNTVRGKISSALNGSEVWVLLGGPPCQAYSIAGRSRNRGNSSYVPEDDERQFLYVEYLQVIAEHQPSVFVMENVKGLLSATVRNQLIFERILSDLREPHKALIREEREVYLPPQKSPSVKYTIFSLVDKVTHDNGDLLNFVVPMEQYGIPQKRHRLILIGIREDLCCTVEPSILQPGPVIPAKEVLDGLPKVRSGLSRGEDNKHAWIDHLQKAKKQDWFKNNCDQVFQHMKKTLDTLAAPDKDRGCEHVKYPVSARYAPEWYLDPRLEGVFNHTTRPHMGSDLYRYLFVACYGAVHRKSPVLSDFPTSLLPQHGNVHNALKGGYFDDRFRVQLADKPATTVTSHISKDGHYYIHYDPSQCRSLTVREAARLQTFPDNYFFFGPRTAQYNQVGNAVPPLLARQVAGIVLLFLKNIGAYD